MVKTMKIPFKVEVLIDGEKRQNEYREAEYLIIMVRNGSLMSMICYGITTRKEVFEMIKQAALKFGILLPMATFDMTWKPEDVYK